MRFLLFLALAAPVAAQSPYDVALDSAYALARADDLEGAVAWYETAFRRARPENPFTPFGAAQDAMRAGRHRHAVTFLHLAAKTGFSSIRYAYRVSELGPIRANADAWDRWLAAVHRAQAAIRPRYDAPLARDLIALALEAERISSDQHALETDTTLSAARAQRTTDLEAAKHALERRVVALLEDRRWPRQSRVGVEGAESASYAASVLSPQVRERYAPAFRAAVLEGEAGADDFARFADQARVDAGRPQLYGTAFWWDHDSQESVQYPVEDGADGRRAEIGMMTLEEWFSRMDNHEWPPRTGWPPE